MGGELQGGLETDLNLADYFGELVNGALCRQSVEIPPVAERYLVNLLLEYSRTEKLYSSKESGLEGTVAFRWLRSLTARLTERIHSLKRLGDFTLYVSGFFPDSLNRQLVDVDYYMSVGESAYGYLSQILSGNDPGTESDELFGALSRRFGQLVDILSEVSERSEIATDTGLLRLYERWIRTRSRRLGQLLQDRGIFPIESLNKDSIQ